MSKRKTDKFDDVHFSSDRFFFANGKWYYYVRTYDGTVSAIGSFPTKEDAEAHCNERFLNKLDFYFYNKNK